MINGGNHNMKNSKRGSALLTVLGITALVAGIAASLHFTSQQQNQSSIINRDRLKARMIAESGLNLAYHAVKKDFESVRQYSSKEDFGGGSYMVTGKLFGNDNVNRGQLTSKGVCGISEAVVSVDLEMISLITSPDGDDDNFYSTDYDLLVGGTMDLLGNFNGDITLIHANGTADLGGSSTVDATTISSSDSIEWKKMPDNVTLLPNQPSQEVYPAALKNAIEAFKAFAEKNGAVYASGDEIPLNPPGGVAYCTGSSKGWSGEGTGCFIFLGDLENHKLNIKAPNGYPSLISLSPNPILLNADSVMNGAVIIPNGEMKLNGHASIYGPLLVGQGLTGNGTADLYAGDAQGFNLPPEESADDKVIITAWH